MLSTWLDEHLETFVRPNLGRIPNIDLKDYDLIEFTPQRIRALVAFWDQAKKRCGDKPMLLAGRDVYLLEVIAHMEGYPTTFRSDISALTASHVVEDYTKHYLVDTGYKGSVPIALKMEHWDLMRYYPIIKRPPELKPTEHWGMQNPIYKAQHDAELERHQLFPRARLRESSPICYIPGLLERCSKYWDRAQWKDGIQQNIQLPTDKWGDQFPRAASLTQYIFHQVELLRQCRRLGVSYGAKKTEPAVPAQAPIPFGFGICHSDVISPPHYLNQSFFGLSCEG